MYSVWLIPHIQIQYWPLSLYVVNTFYICSSLAGQILLSGSFWCVLPLVLSATSSPSVSSFSLLDNHSVVVTVSTWGFSRILGYWPCDALFFYFSSFFNFNLELNMCFVALAFSKADFIFSVLKLSWHCYFPLGLSSILGYWNGFRSFKFKHLLCILPIFVLQIVIKRYCCCFEGCFYLNQTPSSIFSRDLQPLHICFRVWHLVHVQRFECFCANLLQFWDFPVKDACQNYITGTARLLIASTLFLPLSSVLRINLTLLLYSFLIFSFILLCWIPSFSSTPRYLYTSSWSNSCTSVSSFITIFPVEASLPLSKLALAHFSSPNPIPISSLNCLA